MALTDTQITKVAKRTNWPLVTFADGTQGIALDSVAARDFARAIESEVRAEAHKPLGPATAEDQKIYDAMAENYSKEAQEPPAPCPDANPPFNGKVDTWQAACGIARRERDALQAKVVEFEKKSDDAYGLLQYRTNALSNSEDKVDEQSAEIERLKASLPTPANLSGCKTLQDFRFAALYFESQWKACSHNFNNYAVKKNRAIAQQAERIAEFEQQCRTNFDLELDALSRKCDEQSALIEKCESVFESATIFPDMAFASISAGRVKTALDAIAAHKAA